MTTILASFGYTAEKWVTILSLMARRTHLQYEASCDEVHNGLVQQFALVVFS
jgi:hypothetical protein